MPWDDELEQLTLRVHDLYSNDVIKIVMERALTVARRQAQPIGVSSPLDVSGMTCSDGTWTPMSAFYDALKIEFRRLLQPH